MVMRGIDEADGDFRKRVISDSFNHLQRAVGGESGRYWSSYRMSNWVADTGRKRAAKAMVKEWIDTADERVKSGEGLLLYGPVGTGKDHLCFAAVGSAIEKHAISVEWWNGQELFGRIRDMMSEDRAESTLMNDAARRDVLVLSDALPPVGVLTAHQTTMLYRVVEARYSRGKPTCVLVNVRDDAEADERMGAATWDRLCDRAWKIHCNWASHRKPARELK